MPKHYEEDFEQDWEAVVLTKTATPTRPTPSPTFGFRLAEARRHAHFTQQHLAQSLNVSLTLLEEWEANQSTPTKSQLVRLQRVLRQKISL